METKNTFSRSNSRSKFGLVKPGKTRLNLFNISRDSNNYLNDRVAKVKERTGLALGSVSKRDHYNVAANRGETSDQGLKIRDINKSVEHQRVNI